MSIKRKAAPLGRGVTAGTHKAFAEQYSKPASNNAGHQRLAILLFLQTEGPLTPIKARQELGICSFETRVNELRSYGHSIVTNWCITQDSFGCSYLVAVYELMPRKCKRRAG
ncbi:MAG: hypothetical protein GY934_21980 [Gammaproteobacteria bacterium]|nr:hypothetical protein [Gammaproteobacteria bacterium]